MLNLKELENEIQYFETLDAGVNAYGLFANGSAKSFRDAIRYFKKQIPIDNIIPYSQARLAQSIMTQCLMRQIFILNIREKEDYIDFSSIANTKKYQTLRDKLLNNDPALTQVECVKILRQFCNAIAHGDIARSFNFKDFNSLFKKAYTNKISVISNNSGISFVDVFDECLSTVLWYESNYEIVNGVRTKRPAPVKYEVKLSPTDMTILCNLTLSNENFSDTEFSINDKFKVEEFDKKTNTTNTILMDDVQKDAFYLIKKDYFEFAKKLPISDEDKEYIALVVGLQRILLGKQYINTRISMILHSVISIPSTPTYFKKTKEEIMEYTSRYNQDLLNEKGTSSDCQCRCYNAEPKTTYKYLLMAQVMALLEEIDQNCLKVRTGRKSQIITEIATEYFDKQSHELTDKDYIAIIDNIRDAFTHGSFINLPDDRIEIYDQVSKKDKTLEHKFTIYNSDLEKLKDDCLDVFKDLKNDMTKKSNTAVNNTSLNQNKDELNK